MKSPGDPRDDQRAQNARNMTVALLVGQVGFVVVLIIVIALIGGLLLDRQFGTKPLFTIGLLLVSVPISLYAVVRLSFAAVSKIKPVIPESTGKGNRGVKPDEGGEND